MHNNINHATKFQFEADLTHPDPSRMIKFSPLLRGLLIGGPGAGKGVVDGSITIEEFSDIGIVQVNQAKLRPGDTVLLFSLDNPGVAYLETVTERKPSNPDPFVCRTEHFDFDFSNFYIIIRTPFTKSIFSRLLDNDELILRTTF